MVSEILKDEHKPILEDAIKNLDFFGAIKHKPVIAEYYRYITTITHTTVTLFRACLVRLVGGADISEEPDDDCWRSLMITVNSAFYLRLLVATEAMCKQYCEDRGSEVKFNKRPQFMDYITSAIECSKMIEDRKTNWQNFFDGVRVVRNRASHFNFKEHLTDKEEADLRNAKMDGFIDSTRKLAISADHYISICLKISGFIIELEGYKLEEYLQTI